MRGDACAEDGGGFVRNALTGAHFISHFHHRCAVLLRSKGRANLSFEVRIDFDKPGVIVLEQRTDSRFLVDNSEFVKLLIERVVFTHATQKALQWTEGVFGCYFVNQCSIISNVLNDRVKIGTEESIDRLFHMLIGEFVPECMVVDANSHANDIDMKLRSRVGHQRG